MGRKGEIESVIYKIIEWKVKELGLRNGPRVRIIGRTMYMNVWRLLKAIH